MQFIKSRTAELPRILEDSIQQQEFKLACNSGDLRKFHQKNLVYSPSGQFIDFFFFLIPEIKSEETGQLSL